MPSLYTNGAEKKKEKENRQKWDKNMCDKDRIECKCLPTGDNISRGKKHCAMYERRWVGWLDKPKYKRHQIRRHMIVW